MIFSLENMLRREYATEDRVRKWSKKRLNYAMYPNFNNKKENKGNSMIKIDMRKHVSNYPKSDIRDRVDIDMMITIDGIVYGNLKFADEEKGELWYFPDLVNFPHTMRVVRGKFGS